MHYFNKNITKTSSWLKVNLQSFTVLRFVNENLIKLDEIKNFFHPLSRCFSSYSVIKFNKFAILPIWETEWSPIVRMHELIFLCLYKWWIISSIFNNLVFQRKVRFYRALDILQVHTIPKTILYLKIHNFIF